MKQLLRIQLFLFLFIVPFTGWGLTYFSQGNAGFSSLTNWNINAGGGGANPTAADLTNSLHTFVIQNGNQVTVDQNISVLGLTIGTVAPSTAGTLIVGDNATSRAIVIRGSVLVNALGSLVSDAVNLVTHSITFQPTAAGSFTNDGTVQLLGAAGGSTSIVVTNQASPLITTYSFGGAATPANYSIAGLSVVAGSGTITLSFTTGITMGGNVSLGTNGFLNGGSFYHYLNGNWSQVAANSYTSTGTIEFTGTSAQLVSNNPTGTTSTFNHVVINNINGTVLFSSPVTINGDLTLAPSSGTTLICASNVNHTLLGNLYSDASSFLNQTTGSFTFSGTSAQTIQLLNVTFFNMVFSNGGALNPKTLVGDLVCNGSITVNSTAAVVGNGDHVISAGLTLNGTYSLIGNAYLCGGTVQSQNASVNLGSANIIIQPNAPYGSGTVYFTPQAPSTSFTVVANSDLSVRTGAQLVISNNVFFTGQSGTFFNVLTGANLYVRGTNNFPSGFGIYFFDVNTNVIYDSNFNQTVTGGVSVGGTDIVFFNLILSSASNIANTKSLSGGYLKLNGSLTIQNSTTVNFLGNDVFIQGNITSNGVGTNSFNNDRTLWLNNPNGTQTIGTLLTISLNNLYITNDAPTALITKTISSPILATGNVLMSNDGGSSILPLVVDILSIQITNTSTPLPAIGSGTFSIGENVRLQTSGTNTFRNSILSYQSVLLDPASTIRYNNGVNNSVQLIAEGFPYGNIEIVGSGVINYKSACGNLVIAGTFSALGGVAVFRDSLFNVTIGGDYYFRSFNYPSPRANAVFTFNGNYQVIGNNADINLPNVVFDGVPGSTKFFNLSSGGTCFVLGNFTISNNIIVDANSRNLQFTTGNFINTGGTFLQTTGVSTFNAPANFQSITTTPFSSFGSLTINKIGTNTGPSPTQRTLQLLSNVSLASNLTLNTNAADLDMSNITLSVGGNITINTGTTITTAGSTLTMNGSLAQAFNNLAVVPLFNNLVFSGSGSKTLNSGTFNVGGYFLINNALVTSAQPINVAGDWINTGGTFSHTSTVTLNGANQNVSASTFNSLTFGGTSGTVKTLLGAITLTGNLVINSTISLDVTDQNQPVFVAGNFTNNGRFFCNTGTVTFIGGAKTIVTGGTGVGQRFYNLVISGTAAASNTLSTNDIFIINNLTIASGSLVFANQNVTVGGNFLNSDLVNMNGTGGLFLNGSSASLSFDPGLPASVYRVITVSATSSTVTYSLINNNLTTTNNSALVLTTGRLKLNGRTLTMSPGVGNVNIAAAASLEVDAGAQLLMGNGAAVNNNGGSLIVVGNPLAPAFIGRSGLGIVSGYSINQNSGSLSVRYYQIDGLTGNGLTISNPSTLNATNNLSNGTFSNGSGTAYLTLTGWNFTPNFTVNTANFNAGPTRNVSRNSLLGTGTVTFNGSTGSLAGAPFELDPANQIMWTSSAKRWTNSAGDNQWFTAGNWSPPNIPNSGDTVFLDRSTLSGTYSCIINGAAQAYRLIVDNSSSANTITLTINSGSSLQVSENINILTAGANLAQQSATATLNVGGSFINTGTYTANSGEINFNGGLGNFFISAGSSPFFDITFSGSGNYFLASDLTALNNFSLLGGALDVSTSNYNITVGGNWNNTAPGVFIPRFGRIIMNKTGGTQNVTGGPFFNFVSSGTSTKVLNGSVTFGGNVRIGQNSGINGGNNLVTVLGNWTNYSTVGFTQTGTGTIQFTGTSAQNIDTTAAPATGTFAGQTPVPTTFNNIVLGNSGSKTFLRGFAVAANLSISAGCGTVNTSVYQVTGTPSGQFSINGSTTFIIQGSNNFPTGFGTVSLSPSSLVMYQSDLSQTIFATTYGNLDLRRITAVNVTKTLSGNINITGYLTVADVNTQLDATNRSITLGGAFNFPVGGRRILWGSTGTLVLNGPGINFPAAYSGFGGVGTPEFNNLVIGGTGTKTLFAPLNFSGDLTVQNGVVLTMQNFAITGVASKSFNLQGNATLNCALLDPSPAFPSGFGLYTLSTTSTTNLNGGAGNQIISTVTAYGNLNLQNTGNSTLTGNIVLTGAFSTLNAIFQDAGFNITSSGATVDIRTYTPSPGTTITLNGITQALNDNSGGTLDLNNLVFANSGTKTLAQTAANTINILGNVTINSGVTAIVPNRNINFSGSSWINNGVFQHNTPSTVAAFTFNGSNVQTINLGANHTLQQSIVFSKTGGSVTFVGNGGNFSSGFNNLYTPTFTINSGSVVDMGNFTHSIAGTVQNNGTWLTSSASFIFSGNVNQTVFSTGSFTAVDVTIASTNGRTVLMNSDWVVNNFTIGGNATFNTNTANHSIFLTGSWLNQGNFVTNAAAPQAVYFESNNSTTQTINNGNSVFRDVFFNQSTSTARTYQIANLNMTFNRQLTIGIGATLDLNGNMLTLGSNNALAEVHAIQSGGTLIVGENSILRFNNDNGNSTFNVSGSFVLKGTSQFPARLTRSTTNNRYDVNILSGANIRARYYTIEFVGDNGFNVQTGAVVDPVDNFSDGSWSSINTAAGTPKYYLLLNGTVTTTIQNVAFNFTGTPIIGVHFNVRRTVAPPVQYAEVLGGVLGSWQYESDDNNALTGNLRWPLTVTLTWTGAISSDWHVAGNWSPAFVPTTTNNVIIPTAGNAPVLSNANGLCKTMTITNGFLTITSGRTLAVSADAFIGTGASNGILSMGSSGSKIIVSGSWFVGTSGFFTGVSGSSTEFIGANSSLTISMNASSAFQNLLINGSNSTFFVAGSIVNIYGNFTLQAGTYFPNTANYIHYLRGNFAKTGGVFNTGTGGTVNLSGTTNQTITYGVFNNLTISGSATKTTQDTCRVMGNLLVGSGPTFAAGPSSTWDLRGNVTIIAGGTFNDGGNLHQFSGTTWTGLGNCTQNTGTIRFWRNGTQNINGATFNNVLLEGTGAKIMNGNVRVFGDFTMGTAIAYLNVNTSLLSSLNGLGTFFMPAGGNLYIRGAANCPSGFGAYDLNTTSNTYYDVLLNQQIGPISYGNLILNSATTKSLAGSTNVKGNLTINTSTLDVTTSNYTLFVGGNFNNNNTGSFLCNQGEVVFNGTAGAIQGNANSSIQYIYLGTSGTKTFFDLTVNRVNGLQVQINNNSATMLGSLRVQSGDFNINGNTLSIARDMLNLSGNILASGTYVLNNASGSTSLLRTNGSSLNNLTINATNGSGVVLQDVLNTNGNFNLQSGTFDGNGLSANLGAGANTISIQGTYIVGPGGKLGLGNGATCTVQNGGFLEVVGTSTSIARVSNTNAGGRYNFIVNGNIKASNYLFEFMNTTGIRILSTGTIDNTLNFSDGTFTNGAPNGTYLLVDNAQTHTILNVTFATNPGGSARNVAKTVNSGSLTFTGYNGIFAGSTFENDGFNRITWTPPVQVQWTGAVSTDWFNIGNWTPNIVPTSSIDALIVNTPNQPLITVHGAQVRKLKLNANSSLSLNISGPLTLPSGVTIAGDLDLQGTIFCNGVADTITIGGSFTNTAAGNFYPGTGTVVFNSNSGTRSITTGNSQFNNVVINGASTFQLASAVTLLGNLTILQGSLDVTSNNFQLSVRGNWTNNSVFVPRSGTVILNNNQPTALTINNGASAFSTLNINANAGAVYNVVSNNLTTNANLILSQGTLNLNNFILYNGDNVGVDALTISGLLDLGSNGRLLNGAGSSVFINNGGHLRAVGASASSLTRISRQSTGNYSITVNAGGMISARFYQIEYVNSNGVLFRPGSSIHATNNFSDGQFSFGQSGGTYLQFQQNFTDFTVTNVTFNIGATTNVTRLSGSGVITFQDATGLLAGYLFESDNPANGANSGSILWIYTNPVYTWTGAADNNWNNGANWNDAAGNPVPAPPDATIFVNIPNVSGASGNFPLLGSAPAGICNEIQIFPGAAFTLSNNIGLTVIGSVSSAGSITVSPTSTSVITVGLNWSNSGQFTPGLSTLTFNGASGLRSISTGGSAFYNLTFNGGAVYQTFSNLDVVNNLLISAGTLSVSSSTHQLNIGGNWTNNATFVHGNGTVQFNRTSGTQLITDPTDETFFNLNISNTGSSLKTVQLNNTINVLGNLTILNVKCLLNAGSNTINLRGNWENSGSAFVSTGTVNLVGTNQQNINRSNTAGENFHHLVLNNPSGARLLNNITQTGNLTLTNGVLDVSSRSINLAGTTTPVAGSNLMGAGTLTFTTGTITVTGQNSHTGILNKGTGTFNYAGTIAMPSQTIRAINYHNLTSSSTGARVFSNGSTVGISGTFTPGTNAYTVAGSTIDYNGSTAQSVAVFPYHDLIISGAANAVSITKTLGGNLLAANSIAGNLSISGAQVTNGGQIVFLMNTGSGVNDVQVNGNVSLTSRTMLSLTSGTGNNAGARPELFVTGTFTAPAGSTVSWNSSSANASNFGGLIWVNGNVTLNGTLNTSGITQQANAGQLLFNGSVAQTLTIPTASISNWLSFLVRPTSTLNLSAPLNLVAANSNLQVSGTLNFLNGASLLSPPVYATGSTLNYNTGTSFTAGQEWAGSGTTAGLGVPHHMLIQSGTTVTTAAAPRSVAGNLNLSGDLTLGGTLGLAGNLNVQTGVAFNPNNQWLVLSAPSGNQTLQNANAGTWTLPKLELALSNGTATVLNNQNIQVSQALTLTSGKLSLQNQTLTLGTASQAATVSGGSSTAYVATLSGSNISHFTPSIGVYPFPVGDAATYSPITLQLFFGGQNGATITGKVTNGPHPSIGTSLNYLNRYWTLDQVGLASGFGYGVTYQYSDADVVGSESMIQPFKFTPGTGVGTGWVGAIGSGSNYTMGAGNVNMVTNTITWNGLYSFSDITGNGGGSVLPITLLHWDAQLQPEGVHVTWKVASQTRNKWFKVLHSMDCFTADTVAAMPGAGTVNQVMEYAVLDANPKEGINYYQLIWIDDQGKVEYTPWKAVRWQTAAEGGLTIWPNPAKSGGDVWVALKTESTSQQSLRIEVLDGRGRSISSQMMVAQGNLAVPIKLPTEGLSSGLYFIQVTGEGIRYQSKFMLEP